jgi:hypothetical protein
MEENMKVIHKDMRKIQRDLELIKNILASEGKLTEWAKQELKRAREEDESNYTDLEDL